MICDCPYGSATRSVPDALDAKGRTNNLPIVPKLLFLTCPPGIFLPSPSVLLSSRLSPPSPSVPTSKLPNNPSLLRSSRVLASSKKSVLAAAKSQGSIEGCRWGSSREAWSGSEDTKAPKSEEEGEEGARVGWEMVAWGSNAWEGNEERVLVVGALVEEVCDLGWVGVGVRVGMRGGGRAMGWVSW